MIDDSQFVLDSRFWKTFSQKNWRKEPVVIRQAFKTPIYRTSEAFNTLLLSRELRADARPAYQHDQSELRFFIDRNKQSYERATELLPQAKDVSLEQYVKICEKKFGNKDFGIVIGEYQHLDSALWNRGRHFLKGLYERVGMPAGRAHWVLFLSKYSRTPFGVHKDIADVFCFVISGKKRIRTWPFPEFFDLPGVGLVTPETGAILGSIDYRSRLDRSTLLEGEPGDILYWPSTYWHLAEDENSDLAVTVNLGLQCRGSLFDDFSTRTNARIKEEELERDILDSLSFEPRPPAAVLSSAKRYEKHLKSVDFKSELSRWWLSRQTGSGFKVLPRESRESIGSNRSIRVHKSFPLILRKEGSKLLLAGSGHVLDLPQDERIKTLVRKLNSGQVTKLDNLRHSWDQNRRATPGKISFDDLVDDLVRLHMVDLEFNPPVSR